MCAINDHALVPNYKLRVCCALAVLEALCVLTSCTTGRRVDSWSEQTTPFPMEEGAFSVRDIGKPGVPPLNSSQVRLVKEVLSVSTPADRRRLMFGIPKNMNKMALFYGWPTPAERDPPIPWREIGSCNGYWREGGIEASTGLECIGWKPSTADRLVIRYNHVVAP